MLERYKKKGTDLLFKSSSGAVWITHEMSWDGTPAWVGSPPLPAAMTEQLAKRTRGAQFRGSRWIEKAGDTVAHLRVRLDRSSHFSGQGVLLGWSV